MLSRRLACSATSPPSVARVAYAKRRIETDHPPLKIAFAVEPLQFPLADLSTLPFDHLAG